LTFSNETNSTEAVEGAETGNFSLSAQGTQLFSLNEGEMGSEKAESTSGQWGSVLIPFTACVALATFGQKYRKA